MSRNAFIITLLLTLAAAGLFIRDPEIDLTAARLFFDNAFIGASPASRVLRGIFYTLPLAVCAAFPLAWWLGPKVGLPAALIPSNRAVVFIVLSMAIGPGLVVNLGLKDHWHRPRPVHLKEFGGNFDFRPINAVDGACKKNCSFVSGETSAGFWLIGPASLAPPPWRAPAIAGAVVFGALTGLLRMAYGGHFLSDIVLAGLITLLLLQILHGLIFRGLRDRKP